MILQVDAQELLFAPDLSLGLRVEDLGSRVEGFGAFIGLGDRGFGFGNLNPKR